METPNSIENPLAHQFNVVVSIPEAVKIKLVDASLLNEFEIWMYLSTVLLNFATGFWTTYVQNTNKDMETILAWTSLCFSMLFVFCVITAIVKRIKIDKKSKNIDLQTSVSNPNNL